LVPNCGISIVHRKEQWYLEKRQKLLATQNQSIFFFFYRIKIVQNGVSTCSIAENSNFFVL
jgi:hypothetical protein